MKLLILVNNPKRASFRLRAVELIPFLKREGIDCRVLKLPQNRIRRWRLFQSARHYDGVLLHRKCLNFWDAWILRRYSRKIVFDHDDAIMYSPSRPESDWSSHYRLYKRTAKITDVMIAGNEYLAEHARRFCRNVYYLPTGLDTKSYIKQADSKQEDRIRLVWIGSKSTLPYLEELRPVFEQIGKEYKQVILRIIADAYFDLEMMPVEKCRWSLDTQVSDLRDSDIGLAPLPDNRFTRGKCGFKILQYFAASLPVIASPVGVNQKLIEESGAGLLATAPRIWKEAVEKMINEITFYRELAKKGQQYVQQYDVSVVAQDFCKILRETVF